jgi:hypothetical protein
MMVLYLKNPFSTVPCWWYPDSFFHCRRPTSATRLIVRSRAADHGPRRDTTAVLVGGTMTSAPRALAASYTATVS